MRILQTLLLSFECQKLRFLKSKGRDRSLKVKGCGLVKSQVLEAQRTSGNPQNFAVKIKDQSMAEPGSFIL